jgi:hypothetical protein
VPESIEDRVLSPMTPATLTDLNDESGALGRKPDSHVRPRSPVWLALSTFLKLGRPGTFSFLKIPPAAAPKAAKAGHEPAEHVF